MSFLPICMASTQLYCGVNYTTSRCRPVSPEWQQSGRPTTLPSNDRDGVGYGRSEFLRNMDGSMYFFGKRLPPLALAMILVIISPFFFVYFISPLMRQTRQLAVQPVTYTVELGRGKSYQWPAGCDQNDYHGSYEDGKLQSHGRNLIARSCADPKYHLGNGSEYGWVRPSRGRASYYRVGNDAIDVQCRDDDQCEVRSIYRNIFT